jgi:hypothetical protein
MNDLHRKEPGPIGQANGDPPEKILGLYLAQAEKSDKENSESWRANTDGVLVFVRITLQFFKSRRYSILSLGLPYTDWCFLRDGCRFYHSQLPKPATRLRRLHSPLTFSDFATVDCTLQWHTPSSLPDPPRCGFLQTDPCCRARQCAVVR